MKKVKERTIDRLVTPQNIRRLKNPTLVQNLLDAEIEEEQMKYKAPKCWRSSGLGSCLTSRYLERMGVQPPGHTERTLRVFSMGNMIEDFVMDRIEEQIKVERQAKMWNEDWKLAGHCDGLTDEEVIELKSCHSRDFWNIGVKYPPKLHHRLQLWSYLQGFSRDAGRLVYVSKDDMSIKEFGVFKNDEVLAGIVKKEMAILNASLAQKKAPRPIRFDEHGNLQPLTKLDWQYRYSPYGDVVFKQEEYLDMDAVLRDCA